MEIRPLTQPEQKYTYSQSTQIAGQTGCIGHLRGDFGSDGGSFYTTWDDHWDKWKTDEFKAELDTVINTLREGKGLLHNRRDMAAFARANPDAAFMGNYCTKYGFRVDTDKHAFLLRCNPTKGDYNFYCYCYVKEWLDKHIGNAEKGIRFIDPHYKELFRIPDGGKIIVSYAWGEKAEKICRFIDEYHTEVGSNLYHICEFAERMHQNGHSYEPKSMEQPPQKAPKHLFYIFGKKSVFDFKIKNYCLSKEIASEIFKIGIPTLVFQILTSLSISLINNAAADYGDAAIAGMGVVTRLVSMGSLTIFGFIKGFQPIAGYSYGAKKFNRLHEAIKTSIIWSTVFCVVYGLILALFSTSIVSQFASGNLEMVKVGASSLRVNGISLMLFGFYTVYSSLFLALGKGKEGFILGACRQGICFVPVILILPMIWGLNGILYAQPVADVLSTIITVFMAIHLHRELNEAEKQATIAGTNEVH